MKGEQAEGTRSHTTNKRKRKGKTRRKHTSIFVASLFLVVRLDGEAGAEGYRELLGGTGGNTASSLLLRRTDECCWISHAIVCVIGAWHNKAYKYINI